jgi:tetratricopeptide (TPR) repeat protein
MQFKHIIAAAFFLSMTPLAQAQPDAAASKLDLCNQAVEESDSAKAIAAAEDVLKQDAHNREALLCKGRALGAAGQYQQAMEAMQAGEQRSVTPIDHMVALTLTGNVQRDAKHYDEALASYRKSLALAQAEHDQRFERINHNLIGETLAQTNQLDEALKSYITGGELAANDDERADNYARIAATYSSLGKYDKAIEYQIKTVLSEERSGDFNRYAYANLELARIHTVAADYANAEKVLNRIIARSKSQGAPFWEAKSYYYMALEKVANGQEAEAKTLLAQAQQISKKIGADALNKEVSQTLSKM